MQVHRNLDTLPKFNKAVITIGTFDGVHTAHRELIEQIKKQAHDIKGESVLITFDPHPRTVIKPGTHLQLLTTTEEKIKLIESLGIDHLVIVPFTKEFSQQSAKDYVANFLVKYFHPAVVVIGFNHQFGHHRDGNIELLQKLAPQYWFRVDEIHKQLVNDIAVSSSRIRIALQEGDIETANNLLGSPYSFTGKVVHGDKRGTGIGFPTANIVVNDPMKLVPARGVYAVKAIVNGQSFPAMMNIGTRPTVDGSKTVIEVHILNFDKNIYDKDITVQVIARLREEKKFASLDELKAQLHRDRAAVIEMKM